MTNPYAPPEADVHDVVLPPQDTGDLAERGARLAAAIVDNIIFMVMVYLPFLLAAYNADTTGGETLTVIGFGLTLIGFVAWCWLNLPGMARDGQSVAKRLLKIKVVRSDGTPATLGRLIGLRNGVMWILNMIPLVAIVDALFIFNESRQCLHDKIADTIVIKA